MGKFPASLLSIVFQLFLTPAIFADDDVQKVQEELRKRHLFSGNPDGQITPALTRAVARYQEIKNFRPTGIIDFQTRTSLGVVEPDPPIVNTPTFVENSESLRGPNGERLPASPSYAWMMDERAVEIERARREENHAAAALAGTTVATTAPVETAVPEVVPGKHQSSNRLRRISQHKESNPFM